MRSDVVITTHRDLIALAPQPLYLAKALSDRGVRVELVSNAPVAVRERLSSPNLRLSGPSDSVRSPRFRLITIWLKGMRRLQTARIGVAVDIDGVWPLVLANTCHSLARVLYWLEPFYVDYGLKPTFSMTLKRRSLARLLPPDALIDVDCKRLETSRRLCREPASCFVLRNTPPLAFGRQRDPRNRSDVINLVYSGSVTGLGAEGIEHMVGAIAGSKAPCMLTIFPAEGRSVAGRLAEVIREHSVGDRVILKDRVDRSQLSETLSQFDIGVVLYPVRPDQNENSLMAAPNKLYEYLASGLSVIASSNATMQFVSSEGLGWNIEGNAPVETAEFLNQLSRAEVEQCCERAARAFRERYNYESQAEPVLRWFLRKLAKINDD